MKIAIGIIVALILIGGGYLLFANKTEAPTVNPEANGGTSAPLETTNPSAGTDTTQAGVGVSATVTTPHTVTVTYNGSTFSPASVTIKKGDTVRFIETGTSPMWVTSDPHPTHQGYSGTTVSQHCPDTAGTAFDQCAIGSSYTFTFEKVGSWGYHNHANHDAVGTVVVTQ